MWFFALAAAHAETPVLVSAFQARNPEAAGLSGLLEDYLAQALAGQEELSVVRIEDTPPFRDYGARVYIDGCPPGDVVGCTQVIAGRSGAVYAVTGTITALADGNRVEVDILDVGSSRVAVSFRSDLALGEDQVFADGVAQVLMAVVRGEAGREVDIREDDTAAPVLDNEAVAAQLRELAEQLSAARMSIEGEPRTIETPTYTAEDLAEQMRTEGSKPWERLGMSATGWLRYKNSGLPLLTWRQRAIGRQGQLLFQGNATWWNGPVKGDYYARYAVDDSLTTVDSYGWQAVANGSSAGGSLGVAYGLAPFLDVGVHVGVMTGSFTIDVGDQQVGRPAEYSEPIGIFATHLVLGPKVTTTFLPVSRFRPSAGLALDYVQQHGVTEYYDMPATVHVFPAPTMLLASLSPGVEITLSRRLDFVLRVPVDLVLAGGEPQTARTSTQDVVEVVVPQPTSAVAFRIEAGLQVRALGRDVERDAVYEEWEEP